MEDVLGQILVVLDVRLNIVAIQILRQVDKILDGISVTVRIHNGLVGTEFPVRQSFQGSGQVV